MPNNHLMPLFFLLFLSSHLPHINGLLSSHSVDWKLCGWWWIIRRRRKERKNTLSISIISCNIIMFLSSVPPFTLFGRNQIYLHVQSSSLSLSLALCLAACFDCVRWVKFIPILGNFEVYERWHACLCLKGICSNLIIDF